jgi:hypothetical protein
MMRSPFVLCQLCLAPDAPDASTREASFLADSSRDSHIPRLASPRIIRYQGGRICGVGEGWEISRGDARAFFAALENLPV